MDYGMTPTGFISKDITTIYNEIFDELENILGVPVNRNYDSILGSLVKVIASREAQTWQILNDIYYQSFPTTATGQNLSNSVSLVGLRPFGAVASRVYCKCGASQEVNVAKGTQAINPQEPEDVWETVTDQRISMQKCIEADLSLDYAIGRTYLLTIDGKSISVTVTSSEVTSQTVITTLTSYFERNKNIYFDNTENTIKIIAKDENVPFSFSTNINTSQGNQPNPYLTVTKIYSLIRFDRQDITNNDVIELNKISEIVSENPRVESVTNDLPMQVGVVQETDANLRARFEAFSTSPRASSMKEAIKNNIKNYVDLVNYCEVYDNKTDAMNEAGMLPHSLLVVVEGGDNEEIAQMIYKNACAGIDFNGNVTVDVEGNKIKFMRPINKRVYVNITIIRDNLYNNNITNDVLRNIKYDIEEYFDRIGCAQTISAKKIEQIVLNNTDNYTDDVNIELSTVSLDDAQDSNIKILSGKIDTHYYFNNDDGMGVRIYVVDARNTTQYVVQ